MWSRESQILRLFSLPFSLLIHVARTRAERIDGRTPLASQSVHRLTLPPLSLALTHTRVKLLPRLPLDAIVDEGGMHAR